MKIINLHRKSGSYSLNSVLHQNTGNLTLWNTLSQLEFSFIMVTIMTILKKYFYHTYFALCEIWYYHQKFRKRWPFTSKNSETKNSKYTGKIYANMCKIMHWTNYSAFLAIPLSSDYIQIKLDIIKISLTYIVTIFKVTIKISSSSCTKISCWLIGGLGS